MPIERPGDRPGERPRERRSRSSQEKVRLVGVLAGLVALGVVLLVGATVYVQHTLRSDTGATSTSQVPAPPPQVPNAVAPLPDDDLGTRLHYVAMGDSYAAGPGLPDQRDDPAACQRSTNNYPAFLAKWARTASYTDVTCTGADGSDLAGRQQRPDGTAVAPQLDALTPDTDVVTLTLGGNDGQLVERLIATCLRLGPDDPHGDPCEKSFQTGTTNSMIEDAEGLRDDLTAAIDQIRQRAPDAQVVVVGYPQLFPKDANCEQLPFALGDATFAATVVETADEAIRSAAETAGVRYVDLLGPSQGHDICSDDPWMVGVHPTPGGSFAWHPLLAGMKGIAGVVYEQLTGSKPPAT